MHAPNTVSDDLMIRLSTACGEVERITGERPHVATLHRWAQRGLHGVTLKTAFAGGHKRTTKRWLKEFFASVTEAATGQRIAPPVVDAAPNSQRRVRRSPVLLEAGA